MSRLKRMQHRDAERDRVLRSDLEGVSYRDLIFAFLGKLQLSFSSTSRNKIIFTFALGVLIGLGVFLAIYKPVNREVNLPATYIPAGYFASSSGLSENINALSVDPFHIDGLLPDLALRLRYGKFYAYLSDPEPVKITPIPADRTISNDDGVYSMQISSYLAVNSLLGHDIPHSVQMEVSAVSFPDVGSPPLLPEDIILSVDGKKVEDQYEMEHLLLDGLPHTVAARRGDLDIVVKAKLGGLTVKKRIFLNTLSAYRDFEAFANLGLKGYLGTSAGSALALQYYVYRTEDITRERKVAVTGTISETGRIGEVGGVRSKTILAIQHGSQVLFVPQDNQSSSNYTEAMTVVKGTKSKLTVVPVTSLSDIVSYLKNN